MPNNAEETVTDLSASALSAALHQRRLSCVTVMEAYLDRIERLNPAINAILYLRPRAELIAEARALDAELDQGRSRGWMHGFPQAAKDLAEVKGMACSFGSPIFREFRSVADSVHIARARAAGAIFIGKTNTPEFGLGSHTTNPLHGPTRNPFDLARSAGGSSGGAAAALAARLLPVADGSDMMGSLRNPAAFTNTVGFRPSFGRVPNTKGPELFFSQLGTAGPMGRTVEDVGRLLAIQAGHDRRDPLSLPDEDLALSGPAATQGITIAWLGDLDGYLAVEPGVMAVARRSLDVFASLGCTIEDVVPPFDPASLWQCWLTLRSFSVAHGLRGFYDQPDLRAQMNPQMLFEFELALSRTPADIHAASVIRSGWHACLVRMFERYDFLVLPATQVFPFPVEQAWPTAIAGRTMDTYHRWMEVVIGPTLAGLPVAALPAGFGANGLPTGVQLVGPPRKDRQTLEFALAYERARGPADADLPRL